MAFVDPMSEAAVGLLLNQVALSLVELYDEAVDVLLPPGPAHTEQPRWGPTCRSTASATLAKRAL